LQLLGLGRCPLASTELFSGTKVLMLLWAPLQKGQGVTVSRTLFKRLRAVGKKDLRLPAIVAFAYAAWSWIVKRGRAVAAEPAAEGEARGEEGTSVLSTD
jgi:hypothetical protein